MNQSWCSSPRLCSRCGSHLGGASAAPPRRTRWPRPKRGLRRRRAEAGHTHCRCSARRIIVKVSSLFSMAAARYDQRRNLEAQEANVIGTEYQRAGLLLRAGRCARSRALLKLWLDQRILFFNTERDEIGAAPINRQTDRLEGELWESVQTPCHRPARMKAVTVHSVAAGMNSEVLDPRGYTQAAIWNRIPTGAWFPIWRRSQSAATCCLATACGTPGVGGRWAWWCRSKRRSISFPR